MDWIEKHPWMTFFLGLTALSVIGTFAMQSSKPASLTGSSATPVVAPPPGFVVLGSTGSTIAGQPDIWIAQNSQGQSVYWNGTAWSMTMPPGYQS